MAEATLRAARERDLELLGESRAVGGEPVHPEGAARTLLSHANRQNDSDETLVVVAVDGDEDGCEGCGSFSHPANSCPEKEE